MKTLIKTFAFAAAASIALLACEDTSTNSQVNDLSSSSSNGLPSSSSFENSSSSSLEGLPIWNSKVVSYKNIGYPYELGSIGFVMGKDTLKSWFPDILDNEQVSECDYFAIYYSNSSISFQYMIISQDMVLYEIWPSIYAFADADGVFPPNIPSHCVGSEDIIYHAALICDDKAGTLRNNIDISFPVHHRYIDPDWDCSEWVGLNKDVFF